MLICNANCVGARRASLLERLTETQHIASGTCARYLHHTLVIEEVRVLFEFGYSGIDVVEFCGEVLLGKLTDIERPRSPNKYKFLDVSFMMEVTWNLLRIFDERLERGWDNFGVEHPHGRFILSRLGENSAWQRALFDGKAGLVLLGAQGALNLAQNCVFLG